jgi:hypothetical protein
MVLSASGIINGQAPQPRSALTWSPPRTAWGDPDLGGVWNYASGTPLERPAEFAGRDRMTEAEREAAETRVHERSNADRRDGVGTNADLVREANDVWFARRKTIISGRTSLITDPADGRLPPLTAEAAQRQASRAAARRAHPTDSWEDRPLNERCLYFDPSGPPMVPIAPIEPLLGNMFHLRIVQNPDIVAILVEFGQQLRMVPLKDVPHLPAGIRQWSGDSRGRWDGNTLVVETLNLHPQRAVANVEIQQARLVERFTRTGPDTMDYQFTVTDPTTWTRPWTAALPIERSEGEIYEFACHEGNYGLLNILNIARWEETELARRDPR